MYACARTEREDEEGTREEPTRVVEGRRNGRDELSPSSHAAGKGPFSKKRSCALVSPKRSYFFISFGDPVEGTPKGARREIPSLRPTNGNCAHKIPLERDCSLYQAILPRRSLASVVTWHKNKIQKVRKINRYTYIYKIKYRQ